MDIILTRLEQNRFTVNPSKCEWAVQETDWLGYWLIPTGFKPWSIKINAIIAMQAPAPINNQTCFILTGACIAIMALIFLDHGFKPVGVSQ